MCIRDRIYALTFDLDGQGMDELHMIMQFMRNGTNVPMATYVVLSGHGPVSYTHLDVYKRQVMDFIYIIYWISLFERRKIRFVS